MNRKQRRAAEKGVSTLPLDALLKEASLLHAQGHALDAAKLYERAVAAAPGRGDILNNLGAAYLNAGRLKEAATIFARVIDTKPDVLDDVPGTLTTLCSVYPALPDAIQAALNKPQQQDAVPLGRTIGQERLATIVAATLLKKIMRSVKIRDIGIERLLTVMRAEFLLGLTALGPLTETAFDFYGALAEQCFVTEYIYVTTPEEDAAVGRLRTEIETALSAGEKLRYEKMLAFAMYEPLSKLDGNAQLALLKLPAPLQQLVVQHIDEPAEERRLQATIRSLTPVDDAVSVKVRDQYEENPYPRWIKVATTPQPTSLADYLRELFPATTVENVPQGSIEGLIAGCGTGRQVLEMVSRIGNTKFLAVDLSLASLAYAVRKTPADLAKRIEYAQADILNLGSVNRSFDLVSAAGVLHHMADPFAAWEALAGLVRPNGFMHLALYSETARRSIVAARNYIAQHGYQPTPQDIRRSRQEILHAPELAEVRRWGDFYSMSDCRDLLFHVQEARVTIPQIKDALARFGLRFVGFVFHPPEAASWRTKFAQRGWPLTELDRWHAVEQENPSLFAGMYQFWAQKI